MQLVGDLAALLLLHGDQLPIEAGVLLPRHIKRFGERIEAVGDDGKLLHLWGLQTRGVMAVLELQHAAGETAKRIEDAAEHHIEHAEDEDIEREPNQGERGEILPGFGDLVGRLADDDHGVGVFGGDHAHGAADQLRTNQRREPARRLRSKVGARRIGLRRDHGELSHRVHEQDADVAQMLELQGKLLLELIELALRGEVLDGGADKALGDLEGRLDLDAGGGAGVEDRDRPRPPAWRRG